MYRSVALIPFALALACGSDVRPGQPGWSVDERHSQTTGSSGSAGVGSSSEASTDESTAEEQSVDEPGVTGSVRAVIRDYCDQDVERFCRVVYECEDSLDDGRTEYLDQLGWFGVYDYDSCVSYFAGLDTCRLEGMAERGNVAVDADALDECLQTRDEDPCGYFACTGEAIQTIGEDGDDCVFSRECSSGICHGSWSTGECSVEMGTCGPPHAAGEICEFRADCARGLQCNDGKCTQPGGVGAGCRDWLDCQPGLQCVTSGDRNYCAVLLAVGETCVGNTFDDPSSHPVCNPDTSYCDDVTETCEPFKEIGDSCEPNECDFRTAICLGGRCEEIRGLGEACQRFQCDHRLTCHEGTCARKDRLIGEPCEEDAECLFTLWCVEGECAPAPGDGEPCYEGACHHYASCEDGICVADWKRAACVETGVTPFDDD